MLISDVSVVCFTFVVSKSLCVFSDFVAGFCCCCCFFFRSEIVKWLCFTSVLFHRTCGLTESSSPWVPSNRPLRLTPPAQMGSSGFWTCSKSVPKMGGTWPASTWVSSPSSASWCPHFREFVFKTCCSCTVRLLSAAQPVCFLCAGSTTVPARRATWTVPSPSGSCCCGWEVTPATWWAPSWQTSSHCR